jgi:hypothetical protein
MKKGNPVWTDPKLVTAMRQMTIGLVHANTAPSSMWDKFPKPVATRARYFNFYFLDGTARIVFGEDQECEDETDAIACGRRTLAETDFAAVEIWFRGSRLATLHSCEEARSLEPA